MPVAKCDRARQEDGRYAHAGVTGLQKDMALAYGEEWACKGDAHGCASRGGSMCRPCRMTAMDMHPLHSRSKRDRLARVFYALLFFSSLGL